MKKVQIALLVIMVASTTYSCCTFGLVSTWENYVTAETGEESFKIYSIDDSIPIHVSIRDGFHNDRADFAVSIYPKDWTELNVQQKIRICVKKLTLDNFDKKTTAKLSTHSGVADLSNDNACNEYPPNGNYHSTPVFFETDHAWNSEAIIEGTVDIYLDDELLDEINFKQNLRKISHRPICSFGV